MRTILFAIAIALLIGSGAAAQEPLSLDITAHIEILGDKTGTDGQQLGTPGKRLELINIKKHSGPATVKIQYRCGIKNSGETAWVDEGKDCGTRGQSKALQGFAIRLTGEGAANYRLRYGCNAGIYTYYVDSAGRCPSSNADLQTLIIYVDTGKGGHVFGGQVLGDETIAVTPFRAKLADPPKVFFVASVFDSNLSTFYITYRPNAPGAATKQTAVVTVGKSPNSISGPWDLYPRYGADGVGDPGGKRALQFTEALVANTTYVYQVNGKYKDGKEYKSPELTFNTAPLPGFNMGLLTDLATPTERSSIGFTGGIGKPKAEGVVYIEYGTNPSTLGQKTKQTAFSNGEDVWYSAYVNLVEGGQTYFYRLAADYVNGESAKGATLSVKTKDYPIIDPGNPCRVFKNETNPDWRVLRFSEDKVVVCQYQTFADVWRQGSGQEGLLVCPEKFPHNLNTKPFNFKLPYLGTLVTWEEAGPGYWRSSINVRFNDWQVWKERGDKGQENPLRRGSQGYSATNFSTTPEEMYLWIYCSSKWF
jgi:hypothetical protein